MSKQINCIRNNFTHCFVVKHVNLTPLPPLTYALRTLLSSPLYGNKRGNYTIVGTVSTPT